MTRFGITGSGYMGRTHAEAIKRLAPDARLVALWGGSRAPELAAAYGAACESSMEALMRRSDIDAVVITTPHNLHLAEALAALETGKHIMVEKPMATTVPDCDQMLAAAARRGLVVATAYNGRFRNNAIQARKLMEANAIGRVHTMHLSVIEDLYTAFNTGGFGGSKPWFFEPVNVGYVIDGLPHAVDLMRWLTGAEVKSAAGYSRTFTPGWQIEDTTVGIYEFTNGAICSVTSSGAAVGPYPGAFAQYRLLGTEGLLNIDMYGDVHLSDRKQGWRLVATQPKVGFDDASTAFQDVRMKCYVDQIQSFIDGIHGRPMVAGSGFDGRAGVAACLALLESSKEGRIVQLS